MGNGLRPEERLPGRQADTIYQLELIVRTAQRKDRPLATGYRKRFVPEPLRGWTLRLCVDEPFGQERTGNTYQERHRLHPLPCRGRGACVARPFALL